MQYRLHPDDTIAALASAPGPSVRGIVRISGRQTPALLQDWFQPDANPPSSPAFHERKLPWRTEGTVAVAGLWHPCPVALHYWPGRRSYTGECLAELHADGSPPLLEALLAEVFRRGVRPAEPGEFTLRAFLAGRIDLVQAEAVLGVIDASGETELKTALSQLAGGLSGGLAELRHDLLDLLADLEAGLDFADEPIEFVAHEELTRRLHDAVATLAPLREQLSDRTRRDAGWRVVLTGPPNAGKSTLFNALTGQEAALVSPQRGTTRDWLGAELDLAGLPVTLIDTAGTEAAETGIEQAAQARRLEQLAQADLVLDCRPADEPDDRHGCPAANWLWIVTKADLSAHNDAHQDQTRLRISVHHSGLIARLKQAIGERLATQVGSRRQFVGSTSARVRGSLEAAAECLQRACQIAARERDEDLLALEIREALGELGRITGAVYTDDILDRIFSRFCIGK